MCVLNKSKIGINVKDILENENNANLGERAKAQTDSNPLVDVILQMMIPEMKL